MMYFFSEFPGNVLMGSFIKSCVQCADNASKGGQINSKERH